MGLVVADAPTSRYRNYWALSLASSAAGAPQKVVAMKPTGVVIPGTMSIVANP
jgi:hypothetical protein